MVQDSLLILQKEVGTHAWEMGVVAALGGIALGGRVPPACG